MIKLTQTMTNAPHRVSTFTYDGTGRRIRQLETTNGVTKSEISMLWCGLELGEERNAAGSTINKRFFGGGEQIAGTNYFFVRDHLGSVREMTDGSGSIRARYDYDPYGRRTKIEGHVEADFAFTGHYYHAPSELHVALYRAYDAQLGRWLSRDPIGEFDGIGLYLYVHNNPVESIDTLGLASVVIYHGADTGKGDALFAFPPAAKGKHFKAAASSFGIPIDVSNIEHAINKIDTLKQQGVVINELYILDHGDVGYQELGKAPLSETLGYLRPIRRPFQILASKVEAGGTIHLLGCSAGRDSDYLQKLANEAGRTVTGYTKDATISGSKFTPHGLMIIRHPQRND